MTAQQLLESVRILDCTARRRKADLMQIEADMTSAAVTQYDRPVVQGNTPDSGAKWDRLIDARKRYADARKAADDRRKYVNAIIDAMDDPMLSDVLYYKYMTPKEPTWEELGGQFGYTKSGIFYIHDRAVKSFHETSNKLNKTEQIERFEQN